MTNKSIKRSFNQSKQIYKVILY